LIFLPFYNCLGHNNNDLKSFDMQNENLDTIYLGAGCFWCVEAIFQQVNGVETVIPGYCGGAIKNPTYNEVCSGKTGHAEVAKIVFNSSIVDLAHLLEVFWKTHDPTTLNRQGNDIGTQYRSAIFFVKDSQKEQILKFKQELIFQNVWDQPIVTEVEKIDIFYPAEDYHHNYFNNNKSQGYCQFVIQPKIEKYKKIFEK
jgi:peptide-methionine (S)-S-oxide reductase|tara:strand:- start:191 stop:787 length:597 start_codon:yes stop_codon:yes gene_type:complete